MRGKGKTEPTRRSTRDGPKAAAARAAAERAAKAARKAADRSVQELSQSDSVDETALNQALTLQQIAEQQESLAQEAREQELAIQKRLSEQPVSKQVAARKALASTHPVTVELCEPQPGTSTQGTAESDNLPEIPVNAQEALIEQQIEETAREVRILEKKAKLHQLQETAKGWRNVLSTSRQLGQHLQHLTTPGFTDTQGRTPQQSHQVTQEVISTPPQTFPLSSRQGSQVPWTQELHLQQSTDPVAATAPAYLPNGTQATYTAWGSVTGGRDTETNAVTLQQLRQVPGLPQQADHHVNALGLFGQEQEVVPPRRLVSG